jgi:Fe-S-cluster containining protein
MNIPECLHCGACCAYETQWVEVTLEDAKRLPETHVEPGKEEKWALYGLKTPPFAMKTIGYEERCTALFGRIGREVTCSVYENRPERCRTFERGSQECIWFLGFHHITEPFDYSRYEGTGTV